MSDAVTPSPPPSDKFNWLLMAPTLIFDVALPIILFNVLTAYHVSVLWALVIGGASPALNNLRVWFRTGHLEPLGIIIVTFLAIGAVTSLISGNVLFVLVKESFLTGTFGLICLASLLTSRPLLFVILRQFVAGDDKARGEWWNGLWQFENFRKGIRFVTAIWGVVYLLEAFIRVGLALTLTPAEVVNISPFMGFGALIALIVFTRRYMLYVRDRGQRAQQAAQTT